MHYSQVCKDSLEKLTLEHKERMRDLNADNDLLKAEIKSLKKTEASLLKGKLVGVWNELLGYF